MKVKELIKILKEQNKEKNVLFYDDWNGISSAVLEVETNRFGETVLKGH